ELPSLGERGKAPLSDQRRRTDDQLELDRKIQSYVLESGEDFEIYDYGDQYDGLADQLDEAGDDLNDETFGNTAEDVGRFDYFPVSLLIHPPKKELFLEMVNL